VAVTILKSLQLFVNNTCNNIKKSVMSKETEREEIKDETNQLEDDEQDELEAEDVEDED
jgi:hypothetical protein